MWSLIVYYPLCHWVWGGGWLARLGVVDFAGGIVIHTSAGVASLVSAVMPSSDRACRWLRRRPALVWLVLLQRRLVARGRDVMTTPSPARRAPSCSSRSGPHLVGAIRSARSPDACSGFITPASGFIVGLLCGVGYGGVLLFKERLGIDDALDVSSVHGLTGVIGSLLIGVYATSDVNPDGPNRVVRRRPRAGGAASPRLGGRRDELDGATEKVFQGARINRDVENRGLDRSQHGESSYPALL